MKTVSCVRLASIVGGVLLGGTASFGGHAHASHGSTHLAASHDPKAHHEAPKHSGGKPAHHAAPKSEAKPKEHDPHKHSTDNPGAPKQPAGKSKEMSHEEHKPNGLASGSRSQEKSHEHHHELHHHRHGGHEWDGGVDIENGSSGGSGSDGTTGLVVPGDDGTGATAVVPALAGPGLSNRRQIQFSVGPSERDSYEAAARAAGMSRAEWIRSRLNAAVGRESK